jgi:SAM-dependent methyltransferase
MVNKKKLFKEISTEVNFEIKRPVDFFLHPVIFFISLWVSIKKLIKPKIKTNFYFFDGISNLCRAVKDNATNWRALDITYNHYGVKENLNDRVYDFYWHNLRSSRGLRNRLRIVKFLLNKNIEEIAKNKKDIQILSIASGSAQGVIECVEMAQKKGIKAKILLIDLDQSALDHAKELAKNKRIENQIEFVCDRASALSKVSNNFRPDIIEMVGFLEYRPKEKAIKLVRAIYESLNKNGVFITSQVFDGVDRLFMESVLNWSMIYRKPEDSLLILSEAGFNQDDCNFFWEPFKIHYVMECKKL